MLHQKGPTYHTSTYLHLIKTHEDNLNELLDYREKGHGNVMRGLALAMSSAVEDVVDIGQNLFHIVATGSVNIVNDTAHVISSTGNALANIFNFTGGAPNFVLFVVNILIVSYLISQKYLQRKLEARVLRRLNYLTQQHAIPLEVNKVDKVNSEPSPRTRTRTLTN